MAEYLSLALPSSKTKPTGSASAPGLCMKSEIRLFFFSSRRRHTRFDCDWSSDVCSSDLVTVFIFDTLPQSQQVADAAQAANGNNQLLQDVSSNVIPHAQYFKLPDNLENPGDRKSVV